MSLSASTPVGRLFHFERAGSGPIDDDHALITSVNEPVTGLQWRVRQILFWRAGTGEATVEIYVHSKPSKRRYMVKTLDLPLNVNDASWLGSNAESIYMTDETEVALTATGIISGEDWRVLIVGEIVSSTP